MTAIGYCPRCMGHHKIDCCPLDSELGATLIVGEPCPIETQRLGYDLPNYGALAAAGANDRQVGGDHYKAEYQHWDFVHDLDLDYWQACASKYVTRARKKNGLEDLQKAPHYLQKRSELSRANPTLRHSTHEIGTAVGKLAHANGLTGKEAHAIFQICMGWWDSASETIGEIIATYHLDQPQTAQT